MSDAKIEELNRRFRESPEYRELREELGRLHKAPAHEDDATVSITVEAGFVAFLKFIEERDARAENRAPRSVEKLLSKIVNNLLHNELHWYSVQPVRYPFYRAAWNRLCDELGLPKEKAEEPPPFGASR